MIDFKERRKSSLAYRVSLLYRLNTSLLERFLADFEYCPGQIPYIISTIEKEGQTQDELAALIRVNRAATARTLKKMEKAGLVVRKENPENRRQNLVYPTDKSKANLDDLLEILDQHNAIMFEGFSDEERQQAVGFMNRVISNVQRAVDSREDGQ